MNRIFARIGFFENLHFKEENGRVILTDEQTGTEAFNGTVASFEANLEKGFFEEVFFNEKETISLFPHDRDPKFRGVTITVTRKVMPLMKEIIENVQMTKDNFQKLANILADRLIIR